MPANESTTIQNTHPRTNVCRLTILFAAMGRSYKLVAVSRKQRMMLSRLLCNGLIARWVPGGASCAA
ncbi:MAG: hypothetical protein Q7J46_06970 [Pseudomonas sp.]|nr:hypothetical protein [Pseudomonas sp.]